MGNNTQILNLLKAEQVWVRGELGNGDTFGGRIDSFGDHVYFKDWGFVLVINRTVLTNINMETLNLRVQRKRKDSNIEDVISLEEWLNEITNA